jgi:hypothetical protein
VSCLMASSPDYNRIKCEDAIGIRSDSGVDLAISRDHPMSQ